MRNKSKYSKYTDEELEAAISQLASEVAMGNSEMQAELNTARTVAAKRGLNV